MPCSACTAANPISTLTYRATVSEWTGFEPPSSGSHTGAPAREAAPPALPRPLTGPPRHRHHHHPQGRTQTPSRSPRPPCRRWRSRRPPLRSLPASCCCPTRTRTAATIRSSPSLSFAGALAALAASRWSRCRCCRCCSGRCRRCGAECGSGRPAPLPPRSPPPGWDVGAEAAAPRPGWEAAGSRASGSGASARASPGTRVPRPALRRTVLLPAAPGWLRISSRAPCCVRHRDRRPRSPLGKTPPLPPALPARHLREVHSQTWNHENAGLTLRSGESPPRLHRRCRPPPPSSSRPRPLPEGWAPPVLGLGSSTPLLTRCPRPPRSFARGTPHSPPPLPPPPRPSPRSLSEWTAEEWRRWRRQHQPCGQRMAPAQRRVCLAGGAGTTEACHHRGCRRSLQLQLRESLVFWRREPSWSAPTRPRAA